MKQFTTLKLNRLNTLWGVREYLDGINSRIKFLENGTPADRMPGELFELRREAIEAGFAIADWTGDIGEPTPAPEPDPKDGDMRDFGGIDYVWRRYRGWVNPQLA